MQDKKINLTFNQLTAIKHASNVQALQTFKEKVIKKMGILDSAPHDAVLSLFIEWANECHLIAGTQDRAKYMESLDEAIKEANAINEN